MSATHVWLRAAAAALVSVGLFLPSIFDEIGGLRLFVVAAGFVAFLLEVLLSAHAPRRKLVLAVGTAGYIGVVVVLTELISRMLQDRMFAVNAQHLFVMLPLFAALGTTVYRSAAARIYLRVLMAVASVVAVLAVLESVLGLSLLGREYEFLTSQREGPTRALVGSDNPLVLGVTLAALVPLTLKLRLVWSRALLTALLIAGVWASGSRAPAIIATGVAIVQFIPLVRSLVQRFILWVYILAGAVILGLAYASVFLWSTYIPGATGVDYSSNYRSALYALVPQVLWEHPLGYLLASPPPGRWIVGSELHGDFDIVRSLDSEIVFAVFGLGWVGLAFFIGALLLSISTLRRDYSLGLSALVLTSLGFIIALHGWDSMSPLWYVLLGACATISVEPRLRRFAGRRRRRRESVTAQPVGSGDGRRPRDGVSD